MNPAIQKTLSLLLLIFIGVLLKRKIQSKDKLDGIKVLILSIALPATIFVALLKVKIDTSLLVLPVLALLANFSLLAASRFVLPAFTGKNMDDPDFRTMLLLLPSFAPGLSCFPFIAEYLGEDGLAYAALADIGNKIFVLILLYLFAMQLYYQVQKGNLEATESKLKGLLLSLAREPVNLVIIVAIIMLCMGANMTTLPAFLREGIGRMSALMTPMVLLFIGLAVKINWHSFKKIASVLLLRSGFAFLLSATFIFFFPLSSTIMILLAVIFPQSACSFWPFAHISAVSVLERQRGAAKSTFNLEMALNILALSLPFSTVVILTVCSVQQFFVVPQYLFAVALGLILLGFLLNLNWSGQTTQWSIPASKKADLSSE